MVPRYDIEVQLSGEDGNAFYIMGKVSRCLREAGATPEEVEHYLFEAKSGDYDNLLQTTCQWVNVV